MMSSQPQVIPSLPSPPPTIVQSTIQTTPTTPHTPIIVPVPKPQTPRMEMPKPEIRFPHGVAISVPEHMAANSSITMRTMTTACPTITTATPTILSSSNVVYSEQQTTTIHTAQNQNSNKLAQEQENEQFALAWLRATFEPVSAMASRIEQQDLYKMYLTACSKIGRTGVVSQYHFPRCVRNVFGGTVGPNQIKIKQNPISSFFYEGIRIRAQPLAVVHKGTILVSINSSNWNFIFYFFNWKIVLIEFPFCLEQQAAVTTTTIKASDNSLKKDQPIIKKAPIIQNQNKPNTNQTVHNICIAMFFSFSEFSFIIFIFVFPFGTRIAGKCIVGANFATCFKQQSN